MNEGVPLFQFLAGMNERSFRIIIGAERFGAFADDSGDDIAKERCLPGAGWTIYRKNSFRLKIVKRKVDRTLLKQG